MKRRELEHLIRAAAAVTDQYEIVVVGSQSVLGAVPDAPDVLLQSREADCYPRLGRTMEWDIAAGQAVLEAAGGCVDTLEGESLRYGKRGFENPHFVAWGRKSLSR